MVQAQDKQKATIQYFGKSYSIMEAGMLAIKERGLGNLQSAVDIFDCILSQFPDYAEVYNNRGVLLQEMKRYEEALASCDKALALKPGYAEPYNNRGNILQDMRRHNEAVESYDRAIALKPEFTEAHNNRGNALQELKRYDEALISYGSAIALKPDYAEAYNNRGAVLQKVKRHDDALADYHKTVALKPDYAEAYHNLGVTLANKGDMQEAEKMFLKAIELRPGFANPLFSLVNIRKYRDADHADARNIEQLLANPAVMPGDREQLFFSLGKIYDDCGQYDKAFESFTQANKVRSRLVNYRPEVVAEITLSLKEVFTRNFLMQLQAYASQSHTPVFIVGMPRSGTTLMASILSNHPEVDTAGELPTMTEFALASPGWTPTGVPYPYSVQLLTSVIASHLIQHYENRLKRDARPEARFIIDKHPLNFRHLGLIALLFPRARIIHCTRDPMDTCVSNYFQCFTPDYDYSFNLADIAHFYNEYVKIMAHWREVLPANMLEVRYEDMVTDTEKVVRAILDALGLTWNERCLAPHTNPCAVETASHWQVRQPIYKDSIGRWRHYEKHLDALKMLL